MPPTPFFPGLPALAVHYGPGRRLKYSERVFGPYQSAQRAEALAVAHAIATCESPIHLLADNQE
eukprot:6065203-Pyramimonas_sp.AAC.1